MQNWKNHWKQILGVLLALLFLVFLQWNSFVSPVPSPNIPTQKNTVPIEQVFDGDTFSARVDGVVEKIRILGINTPEVSGGHRDAECFGAEASTFVKKILHGKSVVLSTSKTGDHVDRYGRFLRYVSIDGKDLGAMLILEGYAESYKKFPHDRRDEYNKLEKKAKTAKNGMWGKCRN